MNINTQMHVPKHLLIQWHITNRCNLRCSHCYQDEFSGNEPSWDELLYALGEFILLIKIFREKRHQENFPSHITVTGGEPFLHKNFLKLLRELAAHSGLFSFAILSNGTHLTEEVTRELQALKPMFVQVSIDGSRITHDKIRGKGSYDLAVSGLRQLVNGNIPTLISFTASRSNYREFSDVAKLGRRLGVTRVWADRMVPYGHACAQELVMDRHETMEFVQLMKNESQRRWFGDTNVSLGRALQFTASDYSPYKCTAGDTLLTVLPNGDVLPCRRMPIVTGNIFNTRLDKIYHGSEILEKLRDITVPIKGCENCFYNRECRGGLRCLSLASYDDAFRADPGCWLSAWNHNDAKPSCTK